MSIRKEKEKANFIYYKTPFPIVFPARKPPPGPSIPITSSATIITAKPCNSLFNPLQSSYLLNVRVLLGVIYVAVDDGFYFSLIFLSIFKIFVRLEDDEVGFDVT